LKPSSINFQIPCYGCASLQCYSFSMCLSYNNSTSHIQGHKLYSLKKYLHLFTKLGQTYNFKTRRANNTVDISANQETGSSTCIYTKLNSTHIQLSLNLNKFPFLVNIFTKSDKKTHSIMFPILKQNNVLNCLSSKLSPL